VISRKEVTALQGRKALRPYRIIGRFYFGNGLIPNVQGLGQNQGIEWPVLLRPSEGERRTLGHEYWCNTDSEHKGFYGDADSSESSP
jgi:hypothetical protein